MTKTRYFIYNHEAAFRDFRLDGLIWRDGAVRTVGGTGPYIMAAPVLDSGESGNVWQRVLADVKLSEGGRIIWRLFASDIEDMVNYEPESYSAVNSCDFLPIGVCGRYLRLEAQITGGAEIRSLMIYQSWESFLDYLPEIYRNYNSFSDRFLRLFTTQYLDLERKISEFPGTLDPAVAPPQTLRTLAAFAGVRHIGLWEDDGLRKLLVSGIYHRQGQFSVFADFVEYFTGYKPYIAEHFRFLTGEPENDRIYTDADVTVFLPPKAAGINKAALQTVIDDFLPGDIICRIIVLDPHPVISGGAILGVNTQVGRYEQTVVGTARVGITVIGGS